MVQSLRSFVPLRMVREKERSDGWPRRAPASCQTQRGCAVISGRGIENEDDRQRAVEGGFTSRYQHLLHTQGSAVFQTRIPRYIANNMVDSVYNIQYKFSIHAFQCIRLSIHMSYNLLVHPGIQQVTALERDIVHE